MARRTEKGRAEAKGDRNKSVSMAEGQPPAAELTCGQLRHQAETAPLSHEKTLGPGVKKTRI